MIEEAGWVPVRRNLTYEEFAWDWTPPSADAAMPGAQPKHSNMTLHCGRINYTNDLPIYAALRCASANLPGHVARRRTRAVERHAAGRKASTSVRLARSPGRHNWERLVLLPDLCIGARDEVVSVVLVSAAHPSQLDGERIYVSAESASGYTLLRVILERRFGVRPHEIQEVDALGARRPAPPRCSSAMRPSTPSKRSRPRGATISGRCGTNGRGCKPCLPCGRRDANRSNAIPRPSRSACTH